MSHTMNMPSSPETILARALHGGGTGRYIGALLMDAGRLTPEATESILKLQKESGLRFGEAAIQLGLLSEDDIQFALSRQFDYPYLIAGDTSISEEVIAAFKPFSASVERLRALRSQLMVRCLDPESGHRCLAIVSPQRGEGRSYLAANLAVVFSQLGERTLLIDADMRHSRQHELFRLGSQPGLSAVLAGRCDAASAICRVDSLLDLSILPAGAIPPNPQELLNRPAFGQVLDHAQAHYDVVLIDTPAHAAADAFVVAARAGAAVAIGRRNHTATHRLVDLVSALQSGGARVIGTVLNDF
jgi:receptor protein-tyrosine kinase